MNEYHGNPSFRNFTMLSRKMYALFLHYILGGRMRAPPEADLTYLISTFQYGARTDRRALQSKFKSWAKRMVVENYKLKLVCSGKEIIPIEDSCKIVMDMHFQGHQPISQVIKQVQEKYTWTKKNFGMDQEMIIDLILKNCSNLDCIKAIENNELVRNYHHEDLIKDVLFSSETNLHNIQYQMQLSSAQIANSSTLFSWPSERHALPTSSCDIENSSPNDLKTINAKKIKLVTDNSTKGSLLKGIPENLEIDRQNARNNPVELSNTERNENKLKAQKSLTVAPRSFRKPKNINDFKALLIAAEQFTDYPAVLCNPKTKFLGSFGLVPKRICSKKTLNKVEKEQKRKKLQDMQNIIYHQNRKNLRDRNKLNKIKLKEMEKRAYLDFKRNSVETKNSNSSSGSAPRSANYTINNSNVSKNAFSRANNGEIEIVEIMPKIDEPEVIDIASSDDENEIKNSSSKNEGGRDDTTILVNGIKKANSMESSLKEPKTVSSLRNCKVVNSKLGHQSKKTTTSGPHSEIQTRYYPIFKQPYLIPPHSKGEVAILPSSQYRSKDLWGQKISVRSLNVQSSKPVKLTKAIMQGKKSILQPIPSATKPKSFNLQRLPSSEIANKIPHDTNVYLVQKQPSGIIKMVPCTRVIATKNATAQYSKETAKEDISAIPISANNSGSHVSIPSKTKYRNILPAPDKVLDLNHLKILDTNKVFIDEEMNKLSKWIGGMKHTVTRTYFQLNVQRSKQKLESQLNVAIALVKNIRRKLWEIEKLEGQVKSDNLSKNAKNAI